MQRLHVHITGVVQGVGFRPFVHSLADRFHLSGWVINDSRGVEIEVDGSSDQLDSFLDALTADPPPLAQIVSVEHEFSNPGSDLHQGFEIRSSEIVKGERVLISPDVAICQDCLREMYDPRDPRYRYPFLNCTNCGPRFTIIEELPYDRPFTTMRSFEMCEMCACEYGTPSDRRFHAQPTCCPTCGPSLEFLDSDGEKIDGDPISMAIDFLKAGKIVAIKGIGGFHLACDATNSDTVRTLRERKHREAKPLAVMVGGIGAARRLAVINDDAERAILSPARPIVILPENPETSIADGSADGVTGGVGTIGIMLPYAPLHHLLFRSLPIGPPDDPASIILPEEIGGPDDPDSDTFAALVMTSGNISDEPIAADNYEALDRLGGIADGFLMHDRPIHRRADDSVATIRDSVTTIWRWGRGHVPRPVFLPEPLPSVLGVGGELKSTICHIRENKAFVSPHIGDLKTYETYEFLRETIEQQSLILDVRPEAVACDMHPDYHSTRWAQEESGLPVIQVQHHQAHAVALMAEHSRLDGEIIALAMDGTGYGTDGAIWGGDILRSSVTAFERAGHFTYAPLPGGDAAIKEVWRTALGRLCVKGEGLPDEFVPLFRAIPPDRVAMAHTMIDADINCPMVCSLGRLFDAAAFIAGIGTDAQFDGQFPMLLEAACAREFSLNEADDPFADNIDNIFAVTENGFLIDGDELIRELARRRLSGDSTEKVATLFHHWVLRILEHAAIEARRITGLETVGLTGGCFMNRILHEFLKPRLIEQGFEVLTHRIMPTNDGCVSLGQAVSVGYMIK
jgi:hydrogenase maturation protein HypF